MNNHDCTGFCVNLFFFLWNERPRVILLGHMEFETAKLLSRVAIQFYTPTTMSE